MRRLRDEPGLLERLRAGIGPVKTVEESVDELEELYARLVEKAQKAPAEPSRRGGAGRNGSSFGLLSRPSEFG